MAPTGTEIVPSELPDGTGVVHITTERGGHVRNKRNAASYDVIWTTHGPDGLPGHRTWDVELGVQREYLEIAPEYTETPRAPRLSFRLEASLQSRLESIAKVQELPPGTVLATLVAAEYERNFPELTDTPLTIDQRYVAARAAFRGDPNGKPKV